MNLVPIITPIEKPYQFVEGQTERGQIKMETPIHLAFGALERQPAIPSFKVVTVILPVWQNSIGMNDLIANLSHVEHDSLSLNAADAVPLAHFDVRFHQVNIRRLVLQSVQGDAGLDRARDKLLAQQEFQPPIVVRVTKANPRIFRGVEPVLF